jgi:hypothetical protein
MSLQKLVTASTLAIATCVAICHTGGTVQAHGWPTAPDASQATDEPAEANQTTQDDSTKKKEETKQLSKEGRDRAAARKRGDLTFDDLKLEAKKDEAFRDEMLTDDVKGFNKRKIKIRGYILPTSVFQQKGIEQFVLVRDNQECCFGPGSAIYDCIYINVEMKGGATYTTRPVTVEGKFEIDTKSYAFPGEPPFAIYKMEATSVK